MKGPHWLEGEEMSDPAESVKRLILTFGGSFPTTGQGLLNILKQLEAASALPPDLAVHAARYPVRAIGAFIPMLDEQPLELVKFCGMGYLTVPQAVAMVEGMGYWEGESNPARIRDFLIAITEGIDPDTAAANLDMSADEQMHLDFLLETRQHWHNCIVDRVYFVRANGGGWWKTARELGTFRPSIVNSWIRAYEHFDGTGVYPAVSPLVEIPDTLT